MITALMMLLTELNIYNILKLTDFFIYLYYSFIYFAYTVKSINFNVHIQSKLSWAPTPVMSWAVCLGQ